MQIISVRIHYLVAMLFCFSINSTVLAGQYKVGWLEEVLVNDSAHPILAKIDTGADNSSINAGKVKQFKKDGKLWVRFTVTNKQGNDILFEKPIKKRVRIKTKDGKYQRRLVIKVDICLHNRRKEVQVNLVDRSHFKYQMLIGRSFLSPDFIVDSSAVNLTSPRCQ